MVCLHHWKESGSGCILPYLVFYWMGRSFISQPIYLLVMAYLDFPFSSCLSFSICYCFWICVCLWTCSCVCKYSYICITHECVETREQSWEFLRHYPLFFIKSLNWSSPRMLIWLASDPQKLVFLCLSTTEITSTYHHAWPFIFNGKWMDQFQILILGRQGLYPLCHLLNSISISFWLVFETVFYCVKMAGQQLTM